MKNFLLLVALILSFTFDAAAARLRDDVTSNTICKIVGYIQSLYQFPLHGKQMDNNGRKAIMK